ncbi:VOC family protein [Rhizobium sp. 11515TR]|uniref:VOC family protein n=1 Tax=Rhizobium sp. 11515TR TaxID=2028343 RepID=UPI000BA88CF8|nr:VOC family protein [Rhizobium sp. 11515TR]ASW09931.1 glyoxalase/bleomycin resistance/extradiol dioxygenase family protein [Rhizobium sp. 11515TR]
MRITHVALWTRDMQSAAEFWEEYFGATTGPLYSSARRPGFTSRFVSLPDEGGQIELMSGPWLPEDGYSERQGWDHIAIALKDNDAVDSLAKRCKEDGILKLGPRTTGDGFYEAVIAMPDGTPVEITC